MRKPITQTIAPSQPDRSDHLGSLQSRTCHHTTRTAPHLPTHVLLHASTSTPTSPHHQHYHPSQNHSSRSFLHPHQHHSNPAADAHHSSSSTHSHSHSSTSPSPCPAQSKLYADARKKEKKRRRRSGGEVWWCPPRTRTKDCRTEISVFRDREIVVGGAVCRRRLVSQCAIRTVGFKRMSLENYVCGLQVTNAFCAMVVDKKSLHVCLGYTARHVSHSRKNPHQSWDECTVLAFFKKKKKEGSIDSLNASHASNHV
ncbi:hypothetical protein EJ03DRAFT_114303 [Teratosphaeria nubilosa]|uniref:Uncharacterized protein n=1 Tax=Teratosphaeria nubilosa TaxID=161662 RepID=A0A6G1L7C0_9PEZI|nr:hypothetical protein EJ03DRAFT_114303 [Teratosphaeria nubilosa]